MIDKRITPADIPDLFKRLGMKPVRDEWGDGQHCGCLETALAVDAGFHFFCGPQSDPTDIGLALNNWAASEFGETYAEGIRTGWDCGPNGESVLDEEYPAYFDDERYIEAVADGAEAARLVFGEVAT